MKTILINQQAAEIVALERKNAIDSDGNVVFEEDKP